MDKKIVLEIIEQVKPELLVMLLYASVAIIAVLLLKNFLESVVAYFMFLVNKQIGINTRVNIRGAEGVIVDYNRKWIKVSTSDGQILVNMKRWHREEWAVLFNNRRKADREVKHEETS